MVELWIPCPFNLAVIEPGSGQCQEYTRNSYKSTFHMQLATLGEQLEGVHDRACPGSPGSLLPLANQHDVPLSGESQSCYPVHSWVVPSLSTQAVSLLAEEVPVQPWGLCGLGTPWLLLKAVSRPGRPGRSRGSRCGDRGPVVVPQNLQSRAKAQHSCPQGLSADLGLDSGSEYRRGPGQAPQWPQTHGTNT